MHTDATTWTQKRTSGDLGEAFLVKNIKIPKSIWDQPKKTSGGLKRSPVSHLDLVQ